jgi:hypothetical protein
MRLRDITVVEKWKKNNDGSRTLFESVLIPEVETSIKDWAKSPEAKNGILIGGLAVSFWGLPRSTTDIDFLFKIPPTEVEGFKRNRPHAFLHKKTHVEVKVLDANYLNLPRELVNKVYDTAILIDGIYVASKSGLVALKLHRLKRYDAGDIEQLYLSGGVDLSGFNLPDILLKKYQDIIDAID